MVEKETNVLFVQLYFTLVVYSGGSETQRDTSFCLAPAFRLVRG